MVYAFRLQERDRGWLRGTELRLRALRRRRVAAEVTIGVDLGEISRRADAQLDGSE